MFKILFKPLAIAQLKKMRRYYARIVVDAIESHLSEEPDRIHGAIKRQRGKQEAIFRLRVQDYRVFYDVAGGRVEIIQVLHKSETPAFYREDK